MADIFISYRRQDVKVAERLANALRQLGFDVWWDLSLLSGDRYRKVIREVIDQCKAAIVLWSERSVESDFVMDEASHAKNKLCPVRIDRVDLPFGFGQTHTDDLIDWDGELTHAGFQSLVRSIETRTGRKARLGPSPHIERAQGRAAELEAFTAAQASISATTLRAFLKDYPDGAFEGFVRRQLEAMQEAPAPDKAGPPVAATTPALPVAPPEPEIAAPRANEKNVSQRKVSYLSMIGIGGLLVAALAGYMVYGKFQADARRAQVAMEEAQTRAKEMEAKEKEARDQAERLRVAAQQAQDQMIAREKLDAAEREKEARTQAERERLASQQLNEARQELERQKQAQEKASREARDKEQALRAAAAQAAAQVAKKSVAPSVPAPYDLSQLHPQVRAAAERARRVASQSDAAASRGRDAARLAQASGVSSPRDGLGIRKITGDFDGDQFAGYFADGRYRLGVYSYGVNTNNKSNSLRMEGEFANGKFSGGQYFWRSGNRCVAILAEGRRTGPGACTTSTGMRYEGDYVNDKRNGFGVEWDAQGRLLRSGTWTDNAFTTPLGAQGL